MSQPVLDPVRWRDGADQWGQLAEDLDARLGNGPSPKQEARLMAALSALEEPAPPNQPVKPTRTRAWLKLVGLGVIAGVSLYLAIGRTGHEASRAPAQLAMPAEPAAPTAVEPTLNVARDEGPAVEPVSNADPEPTPKIKPRRRSAEKLERDDLAQAVARDPVAELTLLTRARRVLLSDPTRCLALIDEHERLYPHGAFAEEREVLAVEALNRAGRHQDGKARGERFLRDHANSAHAVRVRDLMR